MKIKFIGKATFFLIYSLLFLLFLNLTIWYPPSLKIKEVKSRNLENITEKHNFNNPSWILGDDKGNFLLDLLYTNNHIFLSGFNKDQNGQNSAILLKVDLNGNPVWLKSYFSSPNRAIIRRMKLMDDGNLLVIGKKSGNNTNELREQIIMKIDAQNGDIIWINDYEFTTRINSGEITKMNNDPKGETYIFSNWYLRGNRDDILLTKMDNKGTIVWENRADYANFDDEVSQTWPISGGGIALFGVTKRFPFEAMAVEFDNNGNYSKGNVVLVPGSRITHFRSGAPTSDNGYLVNGYYRIPNNDIGYYHLYGKMNTDFKMEYLRVNQVNYNSAASKTIKDKSGYIYMEREVEIDGERKFCILKFTPDGLYLWSKYVNLPIANSSEKKIISINDGSNKLLIAFSTVSEEGFGNEDFFISIVDTSLTSCNIVDINLDYIDVNYVESSLSFSNNTFNYNTKNNINNSLDLTINSNTICESKDEICNNEIDDDMDGLIDCIDDDCFCDKTCITLSLNLGSDHIICNELFPNIKAQSGFISYLWQDGSTLNEYQTNAEGSYWVQAIDSCGNAYSDTVKVLVSHIETFEEITICQGKSTMIFGNQEFNEGLYTQKFISSLGCDSIHTIGLSILSPDLKIESNKNTSLIHGSPLTINITGLENTNVESIIFSINQEIINTQTQATFTFIPLESQVLNSPTSLNITVDIHTVEGCIISLIKEYTIFPKSIYIPNIFSPNGDGINDEFRANVLPSIEIIDMSIFDRWGNLIFYGIGKNSIWKGTFNGKDVPNGVYVFLISYKIGDSIEKISNDIIVLR